MIWMVVGLLCFLWLEGYCNVLSSSDVVLSHLCTCQTKAKGPNPRCEWDIGLGFGQRQGSREFQQFMNAIECHRRRLATFFSALIFLPTLSCTPNGIVAYPVRPGPTPSQHLTGRPIKGLYFDLTLVTQWAFNPLPWPSLQ